MFFGQFEHSVRVGWRVLAEVSCSSKSSLQEKCRCSWLLPRLAGLFVSAQFALLGVIADSEYVDSMGTVGRRCSMPTLVGLV